jgi:hypothetical protein
MGVLLGSFAKFPWEFWEFWEECLGVIVRQLEGAAEVSKSELSFPPRLSEGVGLSAMRERKGTDRKEEAS